MAEPSAPEALPDASVDAALPRPVFLRGSSKDDLMLLEVEGALEDAAISRWGGMVGDAIKERSRGIAVDLRGCPAIGRLCLSVLLAASVVLRARGGGGVSLVTFPGSTLDQQLQPDAAALPSYSSASRALASLRAELV